VTLHVLVHHAVREELDRLVSTVEGQAEAGGILLGSYRGRDMEVTGMTWPGPSDQRNMFSFTRVDPTHQHASDNAWRESTGTVTYVGEWHTHPYGGVRPSSTDLRSWRSEARRCERPMVFALVVPGEWGLFVAAPRLLWASSARLQMLEVGRVGIVFA
jgi:integrative and conjugative element protein (TIGR02256 family)